MAKALNPVYGRPSIKVPQAGAAQVLRSIPATAYLPVILPPAS